MAYEMNAKNDEFIAEAATDTNHINDLIYEANDLLTHGRYNRVPSKIDSIRIYSEELDYEYGVAYSEIILSDLYLHQHMYDSTEIVAIDLINHPDNRIKVRALRTVGLAYHFRGDFNQAILFYKEALKVVENSEDKRTYAGIQQNLANVYSKIGQRKIALEYYVESLNTAKEIGEPGLLVTTYMNLGAENWGDKDAERAIYYLENALELAEAEDMINNLYRIKVNLANIKMDLGQHNEALSLYDQALDHYNSLSFERPPIIILYNKGALYLKMGQIKRAEEMLNESLKYSIQYDLLEGVYFNSKDLGILERRRGNFEKAESRLLVALDASERVGSLTYQTNAINELYKLYKESNRLSEALSRLEEYRTLTDSLNNKVKDDEIAMLENSLEVKRQTELNDLLRNKQRDQELRLKILWGVIVAGALVIVLISLLLRRVYILNKNNVKANGDLRESRENLRALNEDLKELFSIIAHDIRSPIAAMQGILYLIRETELSKEDQDELLENLEVSLQTNANAMEDILLWSRNQLKGFENVNEIINLRDIVAHNIEKQSSQATLKKLNVNNNIAEDVQINSDKSSVDLILRNLLSNSVKFTAENDSITIDAVKVGADKIKINIADTGIGMSKDTIERILNTENTFTTKGTRGETGTGYGLSLVKEFTNKINGTLQIESEKGVGSTFSIILPINLPS